MATAAAPTTEVLRDRWDAVMDWDRNDGNATEEYENLAGSLHAVVDRVQGQSDEAGDVVDEILQRMRELVVVIVQKHGLAR